MKKLLILTCILAGSASHADMVVLPTCTLTSANVYMCSVSWLVDRTPQPVVKQPTVHYVQPQPAKYTEQQREQMTALVDQLK